MRRMIGIVVGTLLGAAILPAAAQPTTGGFTSGELEYVGLLPFDAGGASGARLVGRYLYVAGAKSLSIYDVSNATTPVRVSTTPTTAFPNEDVDTNGKVLLMADQQLRSTLHVWDVSDKSAPREIATLSGVRDHTFSCVLRCKWAYGAGGSIVDLRDASRPKLAGDWGGGMAGGRAFDVTEVSPGIVLSASQPMFLLDARRNPVRPKQLALGSTMDNRILHSNRWPRLGKDKFILVQGESPFSQTCKETSGAFMTWDATKWRRTKTITLVDQFRFHNGTFVDGSPPANRTGCTVMWFQEHRTFHNGGLVAAAAFDHGTRMLRVNGRGKIRETGWFLPYVGSYIATYWVTDRVLYAVDLEKGIDILRYTGKF